MPLSSSVRSELGPSEQHIGFSVGPGFGPVYPLEARRRQTKAPSDEISRRSRHSAPSTECSDSPDLEKSAGHPSMPLCPVTNRVANAPAESRPPRNPKRQSKRDQFFYGTRPKNCRWAKKPELSNAISSSAKHGQKNADIRQIRYPLQPGSQPGDHVD